MKMTSEYISKRIVFQVIAHCEMFVYNLVMVQKQNDFRKILKAELAERISHNPGYSLRAFARDLDLSPAQMSHLLNGHKGASPQAAEKIGKRLGWTEKEIEYFCSLVASEHSRSRVSKQVAREQLKKYDHVDQGAVELQLDLFRIISDWHHFAILELLKISKQKQTVRSISKRFLISEIETDLALERLIRLGLIEKNGKGYELQQDTVLSTENVSSDAIRKFHAQVLEKAKNALMTQPVQERYFRTQFFPIRKNDLPEAQNDIREFFEKFTQKFSNGDEGDEVYSLGVQYFRLSQTQTET
jgi:uncharacterized protein (TIGR02147 family)